MELQRNIFSLFAVRNIYHSPLFREVNVFSITKMLLTRLKARIRMSDITEALAESEVGRQSRKITFIPFPYVDTKEYWRSISASYWEDFNIARPGFADSSLWSLSPYFGIENGWKMGDIEKRRSTLARGNNNSSPANIFHIYFCFWSSDINGLSLNCRPEEKILVLS